MSSKTLNRQGREDFFRSGTFVAGCNYWASHAGTRMWVDWKPGTVAKDLRLIRKNGLEVLRVFPLWPDFQPLKAMRVSQQIVEFRFGEEPLPDDACGAAGMSAEMLRRFGEFLDMAAEQGLRCIVGLLTGWMSGRLFVPPALEGMNVLTDPAALRWEVRFVRHFVRTFRNHPAVLAWDLGNECNCMSTATREQAYAWTALIAGTIRAEDPSRQVVSGMHSLLPAGNWTPADQGELTDVLTTHPYPVFTPHCDNDPVNTMRTVLHSTAESRMYADLGGKPCLCEEMGTLGPMLASGKVAGDFVRSAMYSLWANDCQGMLWWCAFDQGHLAHAPYDWCAVERELGLMDANGRGKPVLREIARFRKTLDSLPFRTLPAATREAVCILSGDQDTWGVAYSSFVLAKQAGFDLEFQHATQALKESSLYLLPCLSGHLLVSRRRMNAVLAKVRAGATLYISMDSGLPAGFEEITGLEPQTRQRGRVPGEITFSGIEGLRAIPNRGDFKIRFRPTRAGVLGVEPDGNPAFSVARYGKGRVYFLGLALEAVLAKTPGAFHAEDAPDYWRIYRHIAGEVLKGRVLGKTHRQVARTEHAVDSRQRIEVLINHSTERIVEKMKLKQGWKLGRVHHGAASVSGGELQVPLEPHEACIFSVARRT